MVRCFWCVPTGWQRRWFRRYADFHAAPEARACAAEGNHGYHQAFADLDVALERTDAEGYIKWDDPGVLRTDPRWPSRCACGYEFGEKDERQVFCDSIYRREDDNTVFCLRAAKPGAMYDCFWAKKFWKGEDGKSLMLVLPDGTPWQIDGVCSNCPWADGSHPGHKCWVRHGTPPDITVDKNGYTCPVGAGSIASPGYHGMLENGYLRQV